MGPLSKNAVNIFLVVALVSVIVSYLCLVQSLTSGKQKQGVVVRDINTARSKSLKIIENSISKSDEEENRSYSKYYTPIDLVYTWVNGSDPVWQELRNIWLFNTTTETLNETLSRKTRDENRFRDNNELRYSLRSVEKYANWVRRIYIVTADNHIPNWLNTSHPRIFVVHHSAIFPKNHVPTFSSHAIESNVVNIEGLSENFVLMSDDVMFGSPTDINDFFSAPGIQKIYLSNWIVPFCHSGCLPKLLGNGKCDAACNVESCEFDDGDCKVHGQNQKKNKEMYSEAHYYMEILLNKYFKTKYRRKFIAHCPHMFNKQYVKHLKESFSKEYEATSSHRFRHPHDFQMQFSYFHFIIENSLLANAKVSFEEIWDLVLDENNDGLLCANELHSLGDMDLFQTSEFQDLLVDYYIQRNMSRIPFEEIKQDLGDAIVKMYHKVIISQTHTVLNSSPKVTFEMLDDEIVPTIRKLQKVKNFPTKFITLNDDVKNLTTKHQTVRELFYKSVHPFPSSFEKYGSN